MAKQTWKPGNMVYPLPAVMVSVGDKEGNTNILTIAWTGTICSTPAMLYISVRPERHSYHMIKETAPCFSEPPEKRMLRIRSACRPWLRHSTRLRTFLLQNSHPDCFV